VSAERVSDEFVRQFGMSFLQDLVRLIECAYPTALDATRGIDNHLHRNVAGTYRWGSIETRLMAAAESFGLEAQWQPNAVGSAYHVEVRFGRFVLTVARADEAGKLPPEADYRRTLIEATQLRLWSEPAQTDGYVVALVTHGPDADAKAPRFVEALFPDRDGQIADRLDLLRLVRMPAEEVGEERIADGAIPALRPGRAAVGGEPGGADRT